MDCTEFSSIEAEMALGVLTGRERADALAHAESCAECRETVRRLALTGEELLGLLPAVEPLPGFETRVLKRIGIAQPRRPRRRLARPRAGRVPWLTGPRRMLAAAAVLVALLAGGLGGWGLRGSAVPVAKSPLTSAALVSTARQPVGTIYYHTGGRPWMYMYVDLNSGHGIVTCQLEGPGGVYRTVGSFRLNGGYGAWGSPAPWNSGYVTGARLVGADGTILATARFS